MASLTAECFVSDGDAYATLGLEPRTSRQAGSQAAQASRAQTALVLLLIRVSLASGRRATLTYHPYPYPYP